MKLALYAALVCVAFAARLKMNSQWNSDQQCTNAGGYCTQKACRDSRGRGFTKDYMTMIHTTPMCGGAASRVCCFKGSDDACKDAGGECKPSSGCVGTVKGDMCAGTSVRKCCLTAAVGQDRAPWSPKVQEQAATGHGSTQKLTVIRAPADKVSGYAGYTSFRLRSDIVNQYNRLYEAVQRRGGSITSAGATRSLNAKVSYGRAPTSLHYTGAAFDMSIYAGGNKPNKDPMVLVKDSSLGDRRWRVYFRSKAAYASKSFSIYGVSKMTLDAVTFRKNSKGGITRGTQKVTGYFFDFTSLAWSKGFTGIPCWRSTWGGTGGYSGLEFWHFQCRDCIKRGAKFGDELLKMYSKSRIVEAFGKARWDKCKDKQFGTLGFR